VINAHAFDINVMTFNLRVPVDPAPNDWDSRRPRVIAIINNQQPDFLGVQEAVPNVVKNLTTDLSGYAVIGRGRDSDSGGEGTQIFYRKDRWNLDAKDQGTLQLSSTPTIPGSNDWGMQWPRIFTWAHLYEKKSRKAIYVFNTHFPLKPEERDLAAQLLAKYIAERKHKNDSVILTGDFNACEDEASMKYLQGENGSPIAMHDSYRVLHPDSKAGTFHGFGTTDGCKIDYIYTLGKLAVITSDILKDPEGAGFSSDHYAVSARLRVD
jgi:endonuclease/exonuclease/phosphatase family metal-dependent hydrolase